MLQKQMNNALLRTRHGMFHPVPCVAEAETLASHFPQPRRKPLSGDVWLTMFSTQGETFPKSLTEAEGHTSSVPGARCRGSRFGLYRLALPDKVGAKWNHKRKVTRCFKWPRPVEPSLAASILARLFLPWTLPVSFPYITQALAYNWPFPEVS